LVNSVKIAIDRVQNRPSDPYKLHNEIRSMYSWSNVAERTERVYNRVMRPTQGNIQKNYSNNEGDDDTNKESLFADRLLRFNRVGVWAGKFSIMIITVSHLFYVFLEWFVPRDSIEVAEDFWVEDFEEIE
ncbi:hypothetical protein HK100_002465, partial [Physocladia obscura]